MHEELVTSRVNPAKQAWQLVELHDVQDGWYESHVMQAFDVAFTTYPIGQLEQVVAVQVSHKGS